MEIHNMSSFVSTALAWRDGDNRRVLGTMLLMARCALSLDQSSVASGSGITSKTIGLVEGGTTLPNPATVAGLVRFYEAHGVTFFCEDLAVGMPRGK
jgi:DNA-binding XRE family transcriptional regulator